MKKEKKKKEKNYTVDIHFSVSVDIIAYDEESALQNALDEMIIENLTIQNHTVREI